MSGSCPDVFVGEFEGYASLDTLGKGNVGRRYLIDRKPEGRGEGTGEI